MPNLATDLARAMLLNCPFCGNDVNDDEGCFQVAGFRPPSTPAFSVRCGNPSCNADVTAPSREAAITAWNTRAASGGLNEHFGNPEQLGMNEPSGDSGMLPSLEQRARELFDSMMDAAYGDTTIGHIVCAETTRGRLEAAWLPLITAAMRAQPPSGAVSWSEKEQTAIREMMAAQELSYPALVRQAVRLYQRDWIRRRDGETCTWSGDKQREREFSGAALANQQGVGGAQAECDRRGKLLADLYNCDEAQIPVALLRRISACLMGMDEPQPAGDVGRVCNRNCDCVGPCKMGVE